MKSPSHLKFFSAILGCTMTTMAVSVAHASNITFQSWEVASEFSQSNNTSNNGVGPFSYGYETSLNVGFAPLTVPFHPQSPIHGWQRTTTDTDGPYITHNKTNVTKGPFGHVFAVVPPHALTMHPGVNCEYADLRFTAPAQGQYLISGQFYAMDYAAGTTTDVHISVNGLTIYNGEVAFGTTNSASFTPSLLSVALQTNDTIDFQVGCGTDGNYFSDTTGLNAVIERQ